MPRLAATRFS